MTNSPFLTTALKAAENAERVIMKYFQDDIRATLKADQSPVTVADKESERVIIETIRKAFPDHGFLGEESGSDHAQAEYVWIIDPIDGTKNYLRKIPLFATQIALMHRGDLIVGVSNAPALQERLWAERGQGSYRNGSSIGVSNTATLQDAYMVFGGLKYFERTHSIPSLLKLINATQGHRGYGDFWGYHLLAQGKTDIMIEANTKIWDVAALIVIAREAGAHITDALGQPVTKSTNSIIAANPKLHPLILEQFTPFTPMEPPR